MISRSEVEQLVYQHATIEVFTDTLTHEEFSSVREKVQGLGASDAGPATGVSRWESPYSLWCRKTGIAGPKEVTERMRWGVALQEIIAEAATDAEALLMRWDPGCIFRSKRYPWMIATPDYLVIDAIGRPALLEVKNTSLRLEKDWANGDVPLNVQAQGQHQMACTGLTRCLVAALIDGGELRCQWLDFDPEVADNLVSIEEHLWHLIESRIEPPVDGHSSTTDALISRYGEVNDQEVWLQSYTDKGIDAGLWCADVNRLQRVAKDIKLQTDHQKNRIRSVMGEAQVLKLDGVTRATWKADRNGKRALRVMDLDDDDEESF
jgi:putative phage-type endonuclease